MLEMSQIVPLKPGIFFIFLITFIALTHIMKNLILIGIITPFLFLYQNPDFKTLPIPSAYVKVISSADRQARLDSLTQPYNLEKSLPQGFTRDGSVDYTDVLQKAIMVHNDIIFPDFPVLVNTKGLALKSNTKVYFPVNSKIIMQPNAAEGYEILKVKNLQNVND